MSSPKILNQLLLYVNLYQHVKNEVVSLICPEEMVDLEIIQFDWLRAFCSLFHLMCAIARAHASTRATSLMPVKNSTPYFCL